MKLAYLESGDSHAPLILFLHGSPLSARMWQPQLDELLDYHCIAPDLPGHGKSAKMLPFSMQDTVEALKQLIIEKSPSKKAHIIGLSFGGVVAQALMVQTPEVVDRVILSGTGGKMSKALITINKLNAPIINMMKPQSLAKLLVSQFQIPEKYQGILQQDFESFSGQAMMAVLETYGDIIMPANCTAPTLVCVGSKETFLAKIYAKRIAQGIPHAQQLVVPGVGHVWNLQAPELFNRMVRDWLAKEKVSESLLPVK